MSDDSDSDTKSLLTYQSEAELEYKIMSLRETKYDGCFQFNLYLIALMAGLLQGY